LLSAVLRGVLPDNVQERPTLSATIARFEAVLADAAADEEPLATRRAARG
jgi:hypothetical protein